MLHMQIGCNKCLPAGNKWNKQCGHSPPSKQQLDSGFHTDICEVLAGQSSPTRSWSALVSEDPLNDWNQKKQEIVVGISYLSTVDMSPPK